MNRRFRGDRLTFFGVPSGIRRIGAIRHVAKRLINS